MYPTALVVAVSIEKLLGSQGIRTLNVHTHNDLHSPMHHGAHVVVLDMEPPADEHADYTVSTTSSPSVIIELHAARNVRTSDIDPNFK